MSFMTKRMCGFPTGVWIAYIALALLMLAWCMQAYSLLNWDSAVNLGIQNERFTGDAVERTWAIESRGLALADMIWPLPLGILAIFGLAKSRFYGFAAGLMELAIGVYFPLFFAFQRWSTYRGTAITAIVIWSIPSLFGIMGLWINRHEFVEKTC
ncbi:hypothetical protein ACFL47_09475 [Candidatus Latescibacterota bacterium]